MHGRADVVHEAGLGQFRTAAHTAAGCGLGLEDGDATARAGERDRGRESVRTGAHDEGVVVARLEAITDGVVFVAGSDTRRRSHAARRLSRTRLHT